MKVDHLTNVENSRATCARRFLSLLLFVHFRFLFYFLHSYCPHEFSHFILVNFKYCLSVKQKGLDQGYPAHRVKGHIFMLMLGRWINIRLWMHIFELFAPHNWIKLLRQILQKMDCYEIQFDAEECGSRMGGFIYQCICFFFSCSFYPMFFLLLSRFYSRGNCWRWNKNNTPNKVNAYVSSTCTTIHVCVCV